MWQRRFFDDGKFNYLFMFEYRLRFCAIHDKKILSPELKFLFNTPCRLYTHAKSKGRWFSGLTWAYEYDHSHIPPFPHSAVK
jgi:hypothetical protein